MATSTSTLSPTTQSFYTRKALDFLKAKPLFMQHCQVKQVLPMNEGRTVNWIKYQTLAAQTSALTEGTTPSGLDVSRDVITVTPAQYGGFTTVTDVAENTDIDGMIQENIRKVVVENSARSLDIVCRTEWASTAVTVNGGRVVDASFAASDTMKASDIRKAARDLRVNNVPGFKGDLYRAILSPYSVHDLKAETSTGSFIDIYKYNEPEKLADAGLYSASGYVGTLDGVELYTTSLVDTATVNSVTAYRNFVFGADAYGAVELNKDSMRVITKGFESGGSEDPLEQRMTIGWKAYFACKSLDTSGASSKNGRIVMIRTAAGS